MNKFRKLALCLAVSFAASLNAQAVNSQEASPKEAIESSATGQDKVIGEADVKDINQAGDASVKKSSKTKGDSSSAVRKQIQNYLRANNLRGGTGNPKGKVIFQAVQIVDEKKGSSQYPRYVEIAYEKAYMEALQNFSEFLMGKVLSEMSREYFNDDSSNARDFEDPSKEGVSKIQAISEKVQTLAEAQLDQALQKLGVDPSKYASRPKDEKKRLLFDSFIAKAKSATSIQISGVTILQNFISIDDEGVAAVGVLLMQSPVTQDLAISLRNATPPNLRVFGKPLEEQLPIDDEEKMVDFYGSRLLVDDKGPVVVSFGSWSAGKSNDFRIQGRLIEAAEKQAASIARSNLAQFLSLSFVAEDTTTRGSTLENSAIKDGETGFVTKNDAKAILTSVVDQKKRLKSSVSLSGARRITTWQYEDPEDGQITVGVVYAYSNDSISQAKNIIDNQNKPLQVPNQKEKSLEDAHKSGQAASRTSSVSTALDVF